jgi:hypothetical protein
MAHRRKVEPSQLKNKELLVRLECFYNLLLFFVGGMN